MLTHFKEQSCMEQSHSSKNNRYYVLDKSLYNFKPNERWGEAYQKLADILY